MIQLELQNVFGLSAPGTGTLAMCPAAETQHIACYAAGPCVVVYDTAARQAAFFLRSRTSNRAIRTIAWSPDGAYLLAGEAGAPGGGSASVLVWQVGSGKCVQQLRGQHGYGVASLCFSPDGEYVADLAAGQLLNAWSDARVVPLGCTRPRPSTPSTLLTPPASSTTGKLLATTGAAPDSHVCLWDWRSGQLLARQPLQGDAAAAVFTEDGANIVAVGKAAYKVWAITDVPVGARPRPGSGAAAGSSVALTAKPVTLKDHRSAAFVDARAAPAPAGQPPGSCGVYALTASGTLVLMRGTGRMPDKAVNLQVKAAFGLAATVGQVAVACASGTVRLFAARTLEFRGTLPRLLARASSSGGEDARGARDEAFADAVGCHFSACGTRLAVVYRDRSVVLWDVTRPAAVSRSARQGLMVATEGSASYLGIGVAAHEHLD